MQFSNVFRKRLIEKNYEEPTIINITLVVVMFYSIDKLYVIPNNQSIFDQKYELKRKLLSVSDLFIYLFLLNIITVNV